MDIFEDCGAQKSHLNGIHWHCLRPYSEALHFEKLAVTGQAAPFVFKFKTASNGFLLVHLGHLLSTIDLVLAYTHSFATVGVKEHVLVM
jgi:hypothetical protein